VRTFLAIAACLALCLAGCSSTDHAARPYGAQGARLGESLALLGWNMSVSNLRWDAEYVLVDVDVPVALVERPACSQVIGVLAPLAPAHVQRCLDILGCEAITLLVAEVLGKIDKCIYVGRLPELLLQRGLTEYELNEAIQVFL